jgi:hypothetical protein
VGVCTTGHLLTYFCETVEDVTSMEFCGEGRGVYSFGVVFKKAFSPRVILT